jgi:hypothetical protein
MKTVIEKGDIVYVHPLRMNGKVKKVKLNEKTVLVEVILAFNKDTGIRVTKLETVSLKDVEKVERNRKVHGI